MIENLKSSLFLDCERCGALWDVVDVVAFG
jgi:hypothetical protein